MSGKTTLAKRLVRKASDAGRLVFVLDPLLDPEWKNHGADVVTNNPAHFLMLCRKNKNCSLFVDEAGEYCDRHSKDMFWLATQSRHWGHQSYFMSQRANQIAINIRNNCSKLFCFNIRPSDAKLLSDDFCCDELEGAPNLQQGECFYVPRFAPVKKINIFENNS